MPVSAYRYAGDALAQAAGIWNVQKQNMGMLEINLNKLVPGSKDILILSLAGFSVPGRTMGKGTLPYLNGNNHYPTRPEGQGDVNATFRDFPLAGTRRILYQWFSLVYDETSGLCAPSSLLKTTGNVVLFQSDGTGERSATLHGLWPTKMPDITIEFSAGEILTMEMMFSCDKVVWDSNLLAPIS